MVRRKNVTLMQLWEKSSAIEKKLNKVLDSETKYLRVIYDLLYNETRNLDGALSNPGLAEFKSITNTVIRKYQQLIELKKGKLSVHQINKSVKFIQNEISSLSVDIDEPIREGMNITNRSIKKKEWEIICEQRRKFWEESNKKVPNCQTNNELNISFLNIYSKMLRIEHFLTSIHQYRKFFESSFCEFIHHLNEIYVIFIKQQVKDQKKIKHHLDLLKLVFFHKDSFGKRDLPELINGCLNFLENLGITPMCTKPGDRFEPDRHFLIREIRNPSLQEEQNNTIVEIDSPGFLLHGKPYYPASVIIQLKSK
jgi:hypothetical protein